jgi:hypothetical protein
MSVTEQVLSLVYLRFFPTQKNIESVKHHKMLK